LKKIYDQIILNMNKNKTSSGPTGLTTSGLQPPYLKKGDKIAITCPAKKLPKPMTDAVSLLESWGLEVVLGETVDLSFHQFAGDDEQRASKP
jgi:muramoyltetrapeptide carboxypeptidase